MASHGDTTTGWRSRSTVIPSTRSTAPPSTRIEGWDEYTVVTTLDPIPIIK